MGATTVAIIMFGLLIAFVMLGIPVAFVMCSLSIIFGFLIWGGTFSLDGFILSSYGNVTNFVYTALPLYIFMAGILRYSNLMDNMYEAFYRWFGGLRGGLAVASTIIASIMAAMVGVTTVATAALGVTARPSMLSRNYDDRLTTGVILAGSSLGILIPPSILMIIYAAIFEVSPGKMFMAGIIPGIMMALMIIIYSLVVCWKDPTKGPALSKEERYSWTEKFTSLKGIILPIMIILIVILTIFLGIATPTEAAAVGVVGSLISAAINRALTWENIKKMFSMTIGLSVMIMWLVVGATAYAKIISVTGLGKALTNLTMELSLSPILILIVFLIIFFILGMFIDPTAILFMTGPVILPLLVSMEIDLIWFGIIFIIMSCIGNLTPPFGMQLFVLKGVAPDIKTVDLYKAIVPMVGLFIIGIILLFIFPEIATWLPDNMFKY